MQEIDYNIDAWDRIEGIADPRETISVSGHDPALNFLSTKYAGNRLHHAWLLSGPRGIGKATLAFRFAEHLLRHPDFNTAPQNFEFRDDAIHSQVAKGAHPNVLVLRRPWDVKQKKFRTQITVEEVRRTLGFFGTAAGANAWRICIVDPADDLTTGAANALLKILEEPPVRTIFLVLAHSPRGLLPTIRSRCQNLSLKPLSGEVLTNVLEKQRALQAMKPDEIAQITKLAKGSVRRALLLLNSKAANNFQKFVDNLATQNPDIAAIHQLAGSLSLVSKADEFELFMDLIYDHLCDAIRTPELMADPKRQLHISSVWETTKAHMTRMETWNMDKKQVILSLFKNMRAA